VERILFIGAIVILIFGPEKVPAIARTLGQWVAEFQKALHPAPPPAPLETPPPQSPARKKARPKRA